MSQRGSEAKEERFPQRQEGEGVKGLTLRHLKRGLLTDWTACGGADSDGIVDTALFLV